MIHFTADSLRSILLLPFYWNGRERERVQNAFHLRTEHHRTKCLDQNAIEQSVTSRMP